MNVIAISEIGWRACYIDMAIFGFIVAAIAFATLEEPERNRLQPNIVKEQLLLQKE